MAEKIAYFTSELDLTPEEAQLFWPVYNMLQDEREKYHRESRDCMRLLEDAIREGANMVRVGTGIFGPRDYGAPAKEG